MSVKVELKKIKDGDYDCGFCEKGDYELKDGIKEWKAPCSRCIMPGLLQALLLRLEYR
jgi:hypothetical protein